jgi:hypothetical protein
VFSALSVPRLYNTSPLVATSSPEEFLVKFRGSRVIEQETARKLHSDLKLVSVLRSGARRRLVETENPSACAPVRCKLCKSAIALY